MSAIEWHGYAVELERFVAIVGSQPLPPRPDGRSVWSLLHPNPMGGGRFNGSMSVAGPKLRADGVDLSMELDGQMKAWWEGRGLPATAAAMQI